MVSGSMGPVGSGPSGSNGRGFVLELTFWGLQVAWGPHVACLEFRALERVGQVGQVFALGPSGGLSGASGQKWSKWGKWPRTPNPPNADNR